jgi:hypothetical protein
VQNFGIKISRRAAAKPPNQNKGDNPMRFEVWYKKGTPTERKIAECDFRLIGERIISSMRNPNDYDLILKETGKIYPN